MKKHVVLAMALAGVGLISQVSLADGTWEVVGPKSKGNPNGIPVAESLVGTTTIKVGTGNTSSQSWTLNGNANPSSDPAVMWPASSDKALVGTQKGTQTLWLRFVPPSNNPGEVPPQKVSVVITLSGSGFSKDKDGYGHAGYDRAVSISVGGKSGSEPAETVDGFALASSLSKKMSKQISPIQRADGKYYLKFAVDVDNSASVAGPRYDADGSTPLYGGEISVGYGATMRYTSRFVSISSDLGQTYRKSTTQPPVEPGQSALQPIDDSTPSIWKEPVPQGEPVESAANWNGLDNKWVVDLNLYSSIGGFVDPDRKWTLTGGEKMLGSSFGVQRGPQAINETISLGTSPAAPTSTSTITLDVIDRDNGSSSETLTDDYTIHWHAPYENWRKYAPDYVPDLEDCERPALEIDLPGYARNNEGIGFKWHYEKAAFVEAAAGVVGGGAAIAGNVTPPLWAGLFAVVGIAASEIGEVEYTQATANFDSCWSDSRSTFDEAPPTNLSLEDRQDLYKMVPVKLIGYTTVHAKADLYDSHGFAGTGHKNVRKYDGRSASIGNFIKVATGGGNGQS